MKYVGRPIRRREDWKLVTGKAKFIDDVSLPNIVYMAVLRSPYAHAKIMGIDVGEALKTPGVLGVFLGEVNRDINPLIVESQAEGSKVPAHFPLAEKEVNFVGEPVAVVVAESRYTARDALEKIRVYYEPLPAIVDPVKSLEKGSPKVHEEYEDNLCLRWYRTYGDVDRAFNEADVTVSARFRIQRLAPSAIESRGAVASYNSEDGSYTIWSTTQFPHKLREWLSRSLKIPEIKIRVIAPVVGGAFGSKLNHYPEDVLVMWLSHRLGRPVKWVEDRVENMQATTHGRDMIADVSAAVTRDGKILGLRVRIIADLGAYNYVFTQDNPLIAARMIPGVYRINNLELEVLGVFTNKMATDAYRGAGRPEASYIIERTVDRVARKLGLDPVEVRRKNLIQPHEFPHETVTGFTYDSGRYEDALNRALELSGYWNMRREQEKLRENGKLVGIGVSTFVEVCNFMYQGAYVKVEPSGKVIVFTSTSPHGQGEETAFCQLVADELGVSMEDVEIIYGDTHSVPFGWGTAGSWTLTSGGNAILNACRMVKNKMLNLASTKLEARVEDLEIFDGKIFVKDAPDKFLTISDVAKLAYDPDNIPADMTLGLVAADFYKPDLTFPYGAYIAVVEVDNETGRVDVKKLVLVNDCGRVVNPMLVDGQIVGGAVQALGQALYEEMIYAEDGSLLTSTFSDYLIPTALEIPPMMLDRTETPAPNPLGTKGVGELATIGLTQAIVNAIEDAVSHHSVEIEETPVTSDRLWKLLRRSTKRPSVS